MKRRKIKRCAVLDRGFVELVDYMGDDDAPVDAARVSFAKAAKFYTKKENDRLTDYLLRNKHTSPFEMVVFKFRVHAPVVVWWQWVRHRMASYNFVSGRYVPFTEGDVYEVAQNAWRIQSKTNKQGSSGEFLEPKKGKKLTAAMRDIFRRGFKAYNMALKMGVAREQARLLLPFASCYYTAIVQMNASSLMHFLQLREDGHAQSEIRDYATAIRHIVSTTHPRIFGKKP